VGVCVCARALETFHIVARHKVQESRGTGSSCRLGSMRPSRHCRHAVGGAATSLRLFCTIREVIPCSTSRAAWPWEVDSGASPQGPHASWRPTRLRCASCPCPCPAELQPLHAVFTMSLHPDMGHSVANQHMTFRSCCPVLSPTTHRLRLKICTTSEIYLHMHMYTYTRMHKYKHIYTHASTCTHIHMCKFAHAQIQTHAQTHTHTNIGINAYTHVHMYTCTQIHTYTHTHTHIYTYTHIHTYTYTHIHTYTYTHIHIHTHIHIYTCKHIHVHMYMHMHTHRSTSCMLSCT
jgi:hypothetical protein